MSTLPEETRADPGIEIAGRIHATANRLRNTPGMCPLERLTYMVTPEEWRVLDVYLGGLQFPRALPGEKLKELRIHGMRVKQYD